MLNAAALTRALLWCIFIVLSRFRLLWIFAAGMFATNLFRKQRQETGDAFTNDVCTRKLGNFQSLIHCLQRIAESGKLEALTNGKHFSCKLFNRSKVFKTIALQNLLRLKAFEKDHQQLCDLIVNTLLCLISTHLNFTFVFLFNFCVFVWIRWKNSRKLYAKKLCCFTSNGNFLYLCLRF